jgi:flagellar biosynthesis protein FliP
MIESTKTTGTKVKKSRKRKILKKVLLFMGAFFAAALFLPMGASAAAVDVNINGNGANTLEIIEMLTLLSLLPSILIMTTCFTRIIIVLSFLRNALGLQQTPPKPGADRHIAVFDVVYYVSGFSKINTEAYQPYKAEEITQEEFLRKRENLLKSSC